MTILACSDILYKIINARRKTMFANVNAVITITCMTNGVLPTMLMLVENAGLICDTQTLCLTHY